MRADSAPPPAPNKLDQRPLYIGLSIKPRRKLVEKRVQQTLIQSTKTSFLDGGIQEYNFSHLSFSDYEEEKQDSNIGGQRQNPRSNSVATRSLGGKLR